MVVFGEVVPVLCFSLLREENSQQIHNYFLLFLHFFNQASQKLIIRTEMVFLAFLCCFGERCQPVMKNQGDCWIA